MATSDLRILPSGACFHVVRPHGELRRVGRSVDKLRSGLPSDGPMQLVLHGGEEILRQRRTGVVIDREGVNIGDFLVEAAFAGPNLADALQQFVEIVLAEDLLALFQPLIVEDEAFDDEFPQGLGRPNAKLGSLVAVDAVADGDDGVEVVVLCGVGLPVRSSMCKNCTYCRLYKFAVLEDIAEVLSNHRAIDTEEFGQRLLRQPDGFVFEKDLDSDSSIWAV